MKNYLKSIRKTALHNMRYGDAIRNGLLYALFSIWTVTFLKPITDPYYLTQFIFLCVGAGLFWEYIDQYYKEKKKRKIALTRSDSWGDDLK